MPQEQDVALTVAETLGDIIIDLMGLLALDRTHRQAIDESRDLLIAVGAWANENGRADVSDALHQIAERTHAI